MKGIKNAIGWEDEFGNQIGYSKEFAFMNIGRHPKFMRPILKDSKDKNKAKELKE